MLIESVNVTETERWLGIEIEIGTGGSVKTMMPAIGCGILLQTTMTAITVLNTRQQRNIAALEGMNVKFPVETMQTDETIDETIEHMIMTEILTAVLD